METGREAVDVARHDVEATEQIELAVEGMTCSSCAVRVQKVLGRQPGVEQAYVNLGTNRATISYRPMSVSLEELQSAVSKIGYEVTPLDEEQIESEDTHELDRRLWLRRIWISWPLGLAVLYLGLFEMHSPWPESNPSTSATVASFGGAQ